MVIRRYILSWLVGVMRAAESKPNGRTPATDTYRELPEAPYEATTAANGLKNDAHSLYIQNLDSGA
ncbi:MAG: hypothetical protein ACLT1W_13235 [Alistipes onderdonkii]